MTPTTSPTPQDKGGEMHTPTPWKLFHQGSLISIYRNGVDDIIHWTGFDAAHSRGKTTLANAKLIVKAVNSHSTLTEETARLKERVRVLEGALKKIADHMTLRELSENGEDCQGGFEGAYDALISVARDVQEGAK